MYKTVLFDVDGVFLSEERCFDASALSVWELLYAPHFLGLDEKKHVIQPSEERIRAVREQVFVKDQVLDWMKERGLNSNWDMVFLTFSGQLLLLLKELYQDQPALVKKFLSEPVTETSLQAIKKGATGFKPRFDRFVSLFSGQEQLNKHELLVYFNKLAEDWFGLPVTQFSRKSPLWELGYSVYQEWYLGERLYRKTEGKSARQHGKTGFLENEIALADPALIEQLLITLKEKGVQVGIGTGRTFLETQVPFQSFGWFSLLDEKHIATATDVIAAEKAYPEQAPLGKPEPFTYIRAFLGKDVPLEECLAHPLPLANGNEILVVGDSVADLLAARKMGCNFAATLTGLTGEKARAKFEELGADYILQDITELIAIFSKVSVDG
ncbi:MAG: HAD family hydrolase [Thermoactinomyces sp.]